MSTPYASFDVSARSRGDGDAAALLAVELRALDRDRWDALLPILRQIASSVGARFPDVVSKDDALGELALLAHERWLADWVDRVAERTETRSLEVFLRDRLRDHLRERRRRDERRRALLAPMGHGPAVETGRADAPVAAAWFASEPPAPDAELEAERLRATASVDEQARALILLRESGFTQDEIASALHVSRPTVTRRLAAIAAGLVALAGVLILAVFAWPEEPRSTAITPEPVVVSPASDEEPAPASAPEASRDPIQVQTDPPGAEAFVDGVRVGYTPLAVPRPAPLETVELQLRLPGYASRRFMVSAQTQQLVIPLRPDADVDRGRITVFSSPSGAVVYYDGVRVGRTPLAIAPPRDAEVHRLRFELDGYLPADRPVERGDYFADATLSPLLVE